MKGDMNNAWGFGSVLASAALAASLILVGCSDDGGSSGGTDAATDVGADVADTSSTDAGADVNEDTGGTPDADTGGDPDVGGDVNADTGGNADADVGGDPDVVDDVGGDDVVEPDGGGGEGLTGCADAADCLLECSQGDAECATGCTEMLGASVQGKLSPLAECVALQCDEAEDVSACAQENCQAAYDACYAPEKGCTEIYLCDLGCIGDTCKQECVADAEGLGLDQYAALSSCFDSLCTKPVTTDCMVDQIESSGPCLAQAQACVPESGTQKCQQVMACVIETCDPADSDCFYSCVAKGQIIQQIVAPPFYSCLIENCEWDGGFDEACVTAAQNNFCSPQWTACFDQL